MAYGSKTLAATASYASYTVDIMDLLPGLSPDSIIIIFN
jgi:hypothetical protein